MKFNSPKEAFGPAAQRGIALVITLIMLSVTLVMAVAFLAVAQRERATVSISTDSVNARLAADAALAAAQSQILANVVASGNGMYNFKLMVSTNYINYNGFNPGVISPTNVNYDYLYNSTTPLSAAQFEQNIANLQYQPRAPVMISAAEPDGRFYLDLNRNGVFDPTSAGGLPNTNLFIPNLVPYVDASGTTNFNVPNQQVGDPQWIGVLERPDSPHSVDNKFVYRYAFIAVPIGNGLDLNYVHNQAYSETVNPNASSSATDGFFRDQGVGSWEINLAAFLTDLNTNQWDPPTSENTINNNPYDYSIWQAPSHFANSGAGFEDARALLSYRYNFIYNNLATANSMFFDAPNTFPFDNIDEYSHGGLFQTTTTNIIESNGSPDPTGHSWAGADSPNRFFNLPSELYDPTISSPSFTSRLLAAGTNQVSIYNTQTTYDRYTFYRMLAQMGTDSSADDDNKLDLNYDNTDGSGNVARGSQTNLVPWTAISFFTNAADRMLRMYTTNWFKAGPSNYLQTYYGIPNYTYSYIYTNSGGFPITVFNDPNGFGLTNVPFFGITNQIPGFGVSHIPVFVNDAFVYSSAINRVLQLAANMYDASTNAPYPFPAFYPSVFRPRFTKDVFGNVFVTSFTNVTFVAGTADGQLSRPFDITSLIRVPGSFSNVLDNVYGVPWIIGAKKGLPNFNQFYMQNNVQVTRKLQVSRTKIEGYHGGSTSGDFSTNEMFIMSVTGNIGCSLWNSYTTNYPGAPTFFVNDIMSMGLSNAIVTVNATSNFLASSSLPIRSWPGSAWNTNLAPGFRQAAPGSFIFSNWSFPFQPSSVYNFHTGRLVPLTDVPTPTFDTNVLNLPNLPQFALMITNHLQAYIFDNNRIVDYVQFGGPSSTTNLNNELADAYSGANNPPYAMWYTNILGVGTSPGGPTLGLMNQITVSRSGPGVAPTAPPAGWIAPPNMPPNYPQNPTVEAGYFNNFFIGSPTISAGQTYDNTNFVTQAPYTPTRTLSVLTLWQANDPLVHYLSTDLNEVNNYTGPQRSDDTADAPLPRIVQNALGQQGNIIGDDRYQPWGRTNQLVSLNNVDKNAYNLAFRDPLMYSSDDWDFPDNRYPSVGWLGRVHRGTPWQTVYLKATNINDYVNTKIPASGQITWMDWTGNGNVVDAFNALPAQDNLIFDLFTTALDDNASRGTLSVNQTGVAAWSAVLSGVNVISNATEVPGFGSPPLQANVVINPAGVDTNSPVWKIYNDIQATRANTALFGNQAFSHVGHILLVPTLTEHSPFLNNSNSIEQQFDVSDEMYERIPQQVMGLLRLGSPRYVIYCYGQALRPAQDGTALDTGNFGLVTNYQVVAESVSRAVVTVHPQVVYQPPNAPTTNYTTTVESYNVLPSN
jgi:hypothetical protein